MITLLMGLAFASPATAPLPDDFSNELCPQILEDLSLIWITPSIAITAPLFFLQSFLSIFFPASHGASAGLITIFVISNTVIWTLIFRGIVECVRWASKKLQSFKK